MKETGRHHWSGHSRCLVASLPFCVCLPLTALGESESEVGERSEKSKLEAVAFLRRARKSLSLQIPRPWTRRNKDFLSPFWEEGDRQTPL